MCEPLQGVILKLTCKLQEESTIHILKGEEYMSGFSFKNYAY